jgi:tripartite-type tricarboxylate transporter receptor subunit TctC
MRIAALAVAALATVATHALAQPYPAKPIRLVVPNPPGGTVELVARSIAPSIEALGQPVVIELKPGGNGLIGLDAAARAPADGYTLVMATTAIVTAPLLLKVPFDGMNAFTPVAAVGSTPNVFVANPAVPASSIQELVALSHTTPINCAASTPASAINLAVARFKLLSHADFNVVPYQGGVQSVMSAVGGHASIAFAPVSDAAPHIASGKLRAIAVTSLERYDRIPDVPTLAESGYPGFQAIQWFGVAAPAGTPREVIEKLSAAILRAVEQPEVRARFASLGIQPMPMGPEKFAEHLKSESRIFAEVIRVTGIKVE